MKISHESPISMLEYSRSYNDYDYALVHLLNNERYLNYFEKSVQDGRMVILDNSIFELGTAFESHEFLSWIQRLKPSEYIIPDVLENSVQTCSSAMTWALQFRDHVPEGCKSIGVVQGRTWDEIVTCYDYLDQYVDVDKIAFSFDYSIYLQLAPHPNKWVSYALGRARMLADLIEARVINVNKPHHLLGCALPIEFMFYRDYDFLDSLDTSNPVVHGLLGIGYEPGGLSFKESIKLAEMIDSPFPSPSRLHTIKHNTQYFRSYVHGYQLDRTV